MNSVLSHLGEYLEGFLQPLAGKSLSYLKANKEVLTSLQHLKIDEHNILVTADVELLCTNMQQQDATNANRMGTKQAYRSKIQTKTGNTRWIRACHD